MVPRPLVVMADDDYIDIDTNALKRRATAIVAVVNGRSGSRYTTADLRICLRWQGSPLEPAWEASLGTPCCTSTGDTPSHALDELTASLARHHRMSDQDFSKAFELEVETDG